MKHILRAIVGPQAGAVIVLGRRTTLGRASDCDIQILHGGVSRHHAKFQLDAEGVTVTDLSSDNGTYVNGERVSRYRLRPGDSLRVMSSRFAYEVIDDATPIQTGEVYHHKVTSGESLRRTGPIVISEAADTEPGSSRLQAAPRPSRAPPPIPAPMPTRRKRSTAEGMPRAGGERTWRGSPTPPVGASPPGESSGTYSAGHSGHWRRSAEETTRRPPTGPVPSVRGEPREDRDSPVPSASVSRSGWRTEGVAESPPVTSGSGAFRRPTPPRTPQVTGRYGTEEGDTPPPLQQADRLVPPAARGGSAPMGPRGRGTAELPASEVEDAQLKGAPDGSAVPVRDEPFRFTAPRSAGEGEDDAAARSSSARSRGHAPWIRGERSSEIPLGPVEDARAEPDGAVGFGGRGPARRHAIDDVGSVARRIGTPSAPVPPTPAATPDPVRRKATTAEYAPPEYDADPPPRPDVGTDAPGSDSDSDALGSGTDERAMERLASALRQRTAGELRPDDRYAGLEDLDSGDGSAALSAVLQYREFRLRTLQGGRLTGVERRRYDHLDRVLQRSVDGDDIAAMRRFARFACELPGELGYTRGSGLDSIAVAVYDLGAGGARLDIGGTKLPEGELVWLALDLTNVPDVPKAGARKVVFRCRVVWRDGAQMGVVFAGAPKYDSPMGL